MRKCRRGLKKWSAKKPRTDVLVSLVAAASETKLLGTTQDQAVRAVGISLREVRTQECSHRSLHQQIQHHRRRARARP